jgi:hypothetical protein
MRLVGDGNALQKILRRTGADRAWGGSRLRAGKIGATSDKSVLRVHLSAAPSTPAPRSPSYASAAGFASGLLQPGPRSSSQQHGPGQFVTSWLLPIQPLPRRGAAVAAPLAEAQAPGAARYALSPGTRGSERPPPQGYQHGGRALGTICAKTRYSGSARGAQVMNRAGPPEMQQLRGGSGKRSAALRREPRQHRGRKSPRVRMRGYRARHCSVARCARAIIALRVPGRLAADPLFDLGSFRHRIDRRSPVSRPLLMVGALLRPRV